MEAAATPSNITKPSFISTLFQPTDLVEIRKFKGKKPMGSEWYPAQELRHHLVRLKKENDSGVTIYFGVNPRKESGSKDAAGVITCRNIFVDIDAHESPMTEEEFRSILAASKLPYPSVIVFSGHGYHCYWKLNLVQPTEWMAAQKMLLRAFNGQDYMSQPKASDKADRTIIDLPRIMRLPGFKNWRDPENPVVCKVLEINPNVYIPSQFITSVEVSPVDRAKKYLEGTPGAVSGSGGDAHTFTVACRLVNDFSLDVGEAWPLFQEWNLKCSPPWSDSELQKKMNNAKKYANATPGKLLGETKKTFQDTTPRADRREVKFDADKITALTQDLTLLAGTTLIWSNSQNKLIKPDSIRLQFNKEGKMWIMSDSKKVINEDDLVFEPAGCKPGQINMFRGFTVRPAPGKTDLIQKHISTLCGDDESLTRWVTSWMAYPLQHPGAKMQTALVVHGTFGTGKNLLFDAYSRLFDPYSIALNQQILDGRFTGWLSQKCFILADEVIAQAHQGLIKNRLKALITSSDITVEEKGLPCRREHNHANFVFLSNNDMPLLVDHRDRRYTVIRCDNVLDEDYYSCLASQLIGPGTSEAFLDYLLKYDCGEFFEHSKPPRTEAKEALIDLCRPGHHRFIDLWKQGLIGQIENKSIHAHDLYVIYKIWCESSGERQYMVSETKFGKDAKKELENYHSKTGKVYKGVVPGLVESSTISDYRKEVMSEKM